MTPEFITNHLWQTSCFVIFAGLLAFALRKSPPKVRYWIWLSASLKFLMPLTLLMSLGSLLPQPAQYVASVAVPISTTVLRIAEPFAPLPAQTATHWTPTAIGIAWALGFLTIASMRCRSWLRVREALRAATPIKLPIPIPAVVAPDAAEPGIVGFLRPVLVLPAGLVDHLNASQLHAVLAHEMCHVRRRDNFFAAVHMVVEAIFWFHPLAWWIGSRMVEERERACDEEVLKLGCAPADYVAGILNVCRLYRESPLPCVSGVTGADVKKRLRAILSGAIAREWSAGKKAALAAVGLAALAAPVIIGVLNAPAIRAQNTAAATPRFEVASVKPSPPRNSDGTITISFTGGPGMSDPTLFRCVNFSLSGLVAQAYSLTTVQVKAPQWMDDQMFDISARVPEGATREQFRVMLQNLLIDRFRLAVHHEPKEQAIYDLVVAANGHRLKNPAETDHPKPPLPKGRNGRYRPHETMPSFAAYLTIYLKKYVNDATGLKGEYETNLSWVQDSNEPPHDGPTLEQALQEQLGLKLVATKGPVDFLVVDHADKLPTDN